MNRYLAGWNLPGCLPEMEPFAFDTLAEAEAYLADEQHFVAGDDLIGPDDPYVYWIEPIPEGAQA
jgi:hypothetical protein